MNITSMSLGPLGTNCYIIDNQTDALIVDPGGEPEKIIEYLQKEQLNPLAILLTHAHFDHIGAVDPLRRHFHIDVYLHEAEAGWLSDPSLNRSFAFTRKTVKTNKPDHFLKEGKMNLSAFMFEIIHTPGHSPGSVTFIFSKENFIVSGDVLFRQGVGRTDLPGGSWNELENSIRQKIYTLPDNFKVYPGHGVSTSIGQEKIDNPYVPFI